MILLKETYAYIMNSYIDWISNNLKAIKKFKNNIGKISHKIFKWFPFTQKLWLKHTSTNQIQTRSISILETLEELGWALKNQSTRDLTLFNIYDQPHN